MMNWVIHSPKRGWVKKDKNEDNDLSKVAALLIHAAKIDENFSPLEKSLKDLEKII